MKVGDFLDCVLHRPARGHVTLPLAEEGAMPSEPTGAEPGYFQVRLAEMALTDDRRWHQEIVPATFFLAEFNYAGGVVRQPFFVSSAMLSSLPAGVDRSKLRVRLVDTLVVGPTPYNGGDVALFVGLFQTVLDDRRRAMFSIFEKLFGMVELGALAQCIKMADKLTAEVFNCLAAADIECLLAERRVIGKHALPASGYLAFLRPLKGEVDTTGLTVVDGSLRRRSDGVLKPVDDVDYCLVKIERLALRNDITSMPFHSTWLKARAKILASQTADAQVLMLECGYEVFASPDLSEDHKVQLIQFYQAKLLSAASLLASPATGRAAHRGGGSSLARAMQQRVKDKGEFGAKALAQQFDPIAALTSRLENQGDDGIVNEERIVRHLRDASVKRPRTKADSLMKALAAGSLAVVEAR